MDRILPPDLISHFIDFFQARKQMENFQKLQEPLKKHEHNPVLLENCHIVPHYINHPPNIEIVFSKKISPVINVDSSQDIEKVKSQHEDPPFPQKETLQKTKKIKKSNAKCLLCKQQGKKIQMKHCIHCKSLFHLDCLRFDSEQIPKKYICEKCKFEKNDEIKTNKKQKKIETKVIQIDNTTLRKNEKQRKKQQYGKKLNQFFQRYPYYCQDGKIKFPIEDKLLYIYKEIFQINQLYKIQPTQHPIIPKNLLGNLLQIQNFFSTFRQELEQDNQLIDGKKALLYFTMNCQGADRNYNFMLACLIKTYLKDIFQRNKTDNVKILNQNCFFTLLTNLYQNQQLPTSFIIKTAPQIIRFLSTIPSMKKAFDGFIYPDKLNLQSKISVLISLIKGLSEIDQFHQLVSRRSDKIQQMTKQRGDLVNKLKKDQAQVLSNKQKMKQIATNQQNKDSKNSSKQDSKNKDKQIDKNNKKLIKLNTQKQKSQILIKQFKTRISQISKSLPFMTSQVIFLGYDRNQSQYFFYIRQPHRIYVRYSQYLLCQNDQFFVFEGKDKIVQFIKLLNQKGIHQKHLYECINSLLKDGIIHNQALQDQYRDCFSNTLSPKSKDIVQNQITLQEVIQLISQMQASFTAYLLMRNCQWSSQQNRYYIMKTLQSTDDIGKLKELLKQLQQHFLFVQTIKDKAKNSDISQYQQIASQKSLHHQFKKKIAIRIWGINSQKIKKYWSEYLQLCIDAYGLWICAHILKNYVDKYVKRKVQHQIQIQKKNDKLQKLRQRQRLKQKQRQRQLSRSNSDSLSRSASRSRSRQKNQKKHQKIRIQLSSEDRYSNIPNLRKSTRLQVNKKMNMDSDLDQQQQNDQQQSQNQQMCQICGQYGDMICCDTCPKVFHLSCLKIKQLPQGQWSCYQCLQRMSNQRQTRSKIHKLYK